LLGGGGVDGAIHRAGGSVILEECNKTRNKQGGCATGEAVITSAGNLKAKYVIHTVGLVWNSGAKGEEELLISCYTKTFQLALRHDVRSIAYPCISTGIYRFPKDIAATIVINTINDLLTENSSIESVRFICYDDASYSEYKKYM
jgi:O-acetyl-ADP-ribose deacetylase (regulator of RNase III)